MCETRELLDDQDIVVDHLRSEIKAMRTAYSHKKLPESVLLDRAAFERIVKDNSSRLGVITGHSLRTRESAGHIEGGLIDLSPVYDSPSQRPNNPPQPRTYPDLATLDMSEKRRGATVPVTTVAPPLQRPSSVAALGQFDGYMLGDMLSHPGDNSTVLLSRKDGSPRCALKLIRRPQDPIQMARIRRQVLLLQRLRHVRIVQLQEVVESESHIGISLRYAPGGELDQYLVAHERLTEDLARDLFAQVVSAVSYLHWRGVGHFNIHVGHVLLDSSGNVVLAGFGNAAPFEEAPRLLNASTYCDVYGPPELARGAFRVKHAPKVDIWSCGVLLVSFHLPVTLAIAPGR